MHIKTDFLTCYSCLFPVCIMYSSMEFHPVLCCLLLRTGGWGGFLIDRQSLLSVTEVICSWSLSDFLFCPLSNLDIFYLMMDLTSIVRNQPLICFKIMLSYILNLIGNKIMLTSNFGISLS